MNTTVADRLPLAGLLALAMASFITILTEALPAGLLPQMSASLGVSNALVGQLVTVYAIGSLVAAIPITAATRGWRRRPLLLAAIFGFAIANSVTAVSTDYTLTLCFRFVAGVSAGLLWALLAGYASRMAPLHLKGRAMAIAMAGTPVALSLGVPAGTFLGTAVGWRYTFVVMSIFAVVLIGWISWKVQDYPGEPASKRVPMGKVVTIPGIATVLFVTCAFVLAHNILYTYVAPFLVSAGLDDKVDTVLLIFGVASLASIWITGVLIDLYLRELALAATVLFLTVAIAFGFAGQQPLIIYVGCALWGLSFGGVATLFQTALANAAGDSADIAQSMLVTVWNVAIAAGGFIGGILLEATGVSSFFWAISALLFASLLVVARAARHGFPSSSAFSVKA
ncbi:MFS transporter [Ciceribacter sp. RN22]|uniref:MFS transporter n=1 Tax=Ciceribacter sp. RN22 TaxID=2954932 RepID=UPI002093C9EC|nr:MFS transporter [Ciceribacter sp. RN22]MCO6179437.1 MFS transporter [Ciceribacter sp. RN22]